jgi:hypothetical protein
LLKIIDNKNYPLWTYFEKLPRIVEPKVGQQYFCFDLTNVIGRVKLLNMKDFGQHMEYNVLQIKTGNEYIIYISKDTLSIENRISGFVDISHIPREYDYIFMN